MQILLSSNKKIIKDYSWRKQFLLIITIKNKKCFIKLTNEQAVIVMIKMIIKWYVQSNN